MELIDAIQSIVGNYNKNSGLTDLAIGTVTKTSPLEITLTATMLPIPKENLYLTEPVVEKKLENAGAIQCYEHGVVLPSSGGTVVLNPALKNGDKVLLLRVQSGQAFVVLSRVFAT